MSRNDYLESLEKSKDYGDLFSLVKKVVNKVLGLNRSGLMLYLGDLPLRIGAYHQVGSNGIVLNKRVLKLASSSMSSVVEFNSFIFTLLLHEYLHSLGYLDEGEVENLGYRISSDIFGGDHPITQMASNLPLPKIMPRDMHTDYFDPVLELVKNFEKTNQPYIA